MPLKTIFSEIFLSQHLSDFRLSSVANIRNITILINDYIEELESGKIENSKEEEIKSRFVSIFFGDVLGFNYGNSHKWLLREEKKSITDGTKPDAALGYFFSESKNDDVRAVIEIKNAKTNLDEKQKRDGNQSSIDQAFSYVPKAGGKCKWVIASNLIEIRFYDSLDRSKYQYFLIKDLVNENKLKEFLFLFHKDRLIVENKKEKSPTDRLQELAGRISSINEKPIHIIDKLYNSLKRFEGFGFVDPNYIAIIYPFNILYDHVWHYRCPTLFTLNNEIYNFLLEVKIENCLITFSDKLETEIKDFNIVEAKYKVNWVFKFLNHCLIHEISAIKDYKKVESEKDNDKVIGPGVRHIFHFGEDEGITKSIKVHNADSCDCIVCNYKDLDFTKILSKMKVAEGDQGFNTFEYGYANYLTASNNFKTTYTIYRDIANKNKGKQNKAIEYFLANLNLKLLHNLIEDYSHDDRNIIMDDIKSIDLDKVIYNEIEFDVDKEVKGYLIEVKEENLIYRTQDRIEETLFAIENLYNRYKRGGKQTAGPPLARQLMINYLLLYNHFNVNCIIYDSFKRYKNLTEKVFKGMILSYNTPDWGITYFSKFIIMEAILNIYPQSLQELLKNESDILVEEGCVEILLKRLNNFTSCIYNDGLFADSPYENELLASQLQFWSFEDRFTNIFANIFTVLSRLDISKDKFRNCVAPLLKFLRTEKVLYWFDLKELSQFIKTRGNAFEAKDLIEILKICIEFDKYGNNKYSELLITIPESINKFYPDYRFDNRKLISLAILNNTADDGTISDYHNLIWLSKICSEICKDILHKEFETFLNTSFSISFYEELIRIADYDINNKEYFKIYSEKVNSGKAQSRKYGKHKFTDFLFINYVLILYNYNIDLSRPEIKLLTDLNDFEVWILNPDQFNYNKFVANWLIDLDFSAVLDKLKGNDEIGKKIEIQLADKFDPKLAEMLYKYFKNIHN